MKLDRKYLDHLAKLLRAEIARRDVSDAKFARDIGIAQSQLSSVLRSDATGRGVGVVTLIAIRKALRVSLDDLLGLEPVAPVTTRVRVDPAALDDAIERALDRRFPGKDSDPPESDESPVAPRHRRS